LQNGHKLILSKQNRIETIRNSKIKIEFETSMQNERVFYLIYDNKTSNKLYIWNVRYIQYLKTMKNGIWISQMNLKCLLKMFAKKSHLFFSDNFAK